MSSPRALSWRLLLAVSALVGCAQGSEAPEPSAAQAPSTPGLAGEGGDVDDAASAGAIAPSSLGAGLDEALARAVVPPAGDGTYRVDPFVAALVVAAIEREGERWFQPFAGTPAKVDHEVRGFTVTGVGERAGLLRLGLREGDIVEQVNGVPTTDVAAARGALGGSVDGVTVGVFREDYSFVLGYRFEPGLSWARTLEDLGVSEAPGTDDRVAQAGDLADGGAADDAFDPPSVGTPGSAARPSAPGRSQPNPGTSTPRPSSPSSPSPPSSPKPGSGASSPVTCDSDASCSVRKSYFDSMVSSPSKLESQAKIVPAIRNDVFSGYKLSWIRPGSVIDQLGFKSGDKITHINGSDLTDDAKAFAVYLSLSSTKSYNVRYVRGSQTRTKKVLVR